MILKVRRKDEFLESNKNPDDWILIDGFNRIDYCFHKKEEQIGITGSVLDLLKIRGESSSLGVITEYIIAEDYYDIWLYKEEKLVKQVLAHGPIYILNDEGKTIERI